jgi:hypothetical protein
VNNAIDATVSHMEYLDNLQHGEAYLIELDDRSLHQIGTFYSIQKMLARFLSTSLGSDRGTAERGPAHRLDANKQRQKRHPMKMSFSLLSGIRTFRIATHKVCRFNRLKNLAFGIGFIQHVGIWYKKRMAIG